MNLTRIIRPHHVILLAFLITGIYCTVHGIVSGGWHLEMAGVRMSFAPGDAGMVRIFFADAR